MRTVKSLARNARGQYDITIAGDDGVTAPFRLSEDLVVEFRLLVGRVVDEPTYARFLKELDLDGLYDAALRLISRAAKTAREIRTYLAEKTIDTALSDKVYAKLLAKGFIDDRAYALSYVDYHFGVRREGPVKIRFDLEQKGVFRAYVDEAVNAIEDDAVKRNLAVLFDKKLPTLHAQPREKALQTMKGYLYRKGYEPGIVFAYCDGRKSDFPAGEEEDQKAAADLAKVKRRLRDSKLDGYALKAKLVSAMMNKGYRYETIKRVMEESETDAFENDRV
ncbi:MAG: RecX family transcriptional regulator [Bacillota bacterium]|nr:RecX family transcriptional regulator [Bacillota bacterium]